MSARRIYLTALLVALSLPLTSRAQSYQVVDLGAAQPYVGDIGVLAINDAGTVIGVVGTSNGARSFSYSDGTWTNINPLPGDTTAVVTAINSSGQIVGDSYGSSGEHAFIYSNGTMSNLGALPGDTYTEVEGINSAGQVVGDSANQLTSHVFLYSNGSMTDLGTPYGTSSSTGVAINSAGQIIGEATTVSYQPNGFESSQQNEFLYSGGRWTLLPGSAGNGYFINDSGMVTGPGTNSLAFAYQNGTMTSLGTLPAPFSSQGSSPVGINNAGQIIGESVGSYTHAFLYSDGIMTDLGTLDGIDAYASAINSAGQVVGYSDFSSGPADAFLYENGGMVDLNSLIPFDGWHLTDATGINDNGWIIGNGTNPFGHDDSFLLIPTPEPASLGLLAAGAVTLLSRRSCGRHSPA
jgi:probable HAF family extracellular repeat protein